jgi:putative phosphonate metabolism protein
MHPAREPGKAPRYAIYFVPGEASALYRFGASVLGYDCYSGRDVAFMDGIQSPNWPAIIREPRLYGFHATLKAPFRLATGLTEEDLAEACIKFGHDHAPVMAGALTVSELGSFIALVPEIPRPRLNRLAGACVEAFDRFRAPLTEQERERRLAAGLTPEQIKNLDRWGYPYVFADFRFHMTLSGSLEPMQKPAALRLISEKFEQNIGVKAVTIDQIVIARQAYASTPFLVVHRFSLGQSPYRPYANSF